MKEIKVEKINRSISNMSTNPLLTLLQYFILFYSYRFLISSLIHSENRREQIENPIRLFLSAI